MAPWWRMWDRFKIIYTMCKSLAPLFVFNALMHSINKNKEICGQKCTTSKIIMHCNLLTVCSDSCGKNVAYEYNVMIKEYEGKILKTTNLLTKTGQSLTIESLGAHPGVRSGHSTAMTRRGDRVTLRTFHLLPCTSGCHCHKLCEAPTLSRLTNTSSGNISDIRRADWSAQDEISLRFWAYGPVGEGESERERVEKGMRGKGGSLEPGTQAKQTILNRAALCLRSLVHTTFHILG